MRVNGLHSLSPSPPREVPISHSPSDPSPPPPSSFPAAVDMAVFSLSSVFSEAPALDIFGDKNTSDARRRCRPESDDTEGWELFDMHLRVAAMYASSYASSVDMPYCTDLVDMMEEQGHSLSLLEGNQTADTPWGLGGSRLYDDFGRAYSTVLGMPDARRVS